jgi:hypothetical protein
MVVFILLLRWRGTAVAARIEGKCDYVHPLGEWKLDGEEQNIQPGDTVCLEAGQRGSLRIEDVHGTAANPILIQNSGGQLQIAEGSYSISVVSSGHIRLSGAGDPAHFYGIRGGGTVYVGGLSTNVEVDHVEVYTAGFAGFMVKTDPNCDPATWRQNFTMYDVSLHHNYAHNMQDGEGFYIGFTFYNGYDITCDGQPVTVYGHVIEGLEMYNNITYDTGSEGIQVGSTPVGADIHDNVVKLYGQRPFANFQDNGIQIGSGTGGLLYNNWIEEGPGNGLIMMGQGDNVIFNNVIVNAGAYGVFCDERGDPVGTGYQFINNTIINPAEDGIRIYADLMEMNHIKNNIIVNPGTGDYVVKLNDNVPLEMSNNLFAATAAEAGFVDAASGDYHLQADSPAVDMGLDASVFGVMMDKDGVTRPFGSSYDIGAYEFVPTLRLFGTPSNQTIQLNWEIDTTLLPTATWQIDYEGPVGNQPSPITGLAADTDSYALTGLENYTLYTVMLKAMVGDTAVYTDTLTAMPTDLFIYLPLIQKGNP